MSQQTYDHVFTSNGWETVAWSWSVPWAGLSTQVCVSGGHSLRLRIGFFNAGFSNNGCITMGGGTSVFGQFVQANGRRGDRISVRVTPLGPNN